MKLQVKIRGAFSYQCELSRRGIQAKIPLLNLNAITYDSKCALNEKTDVHE